MKIKIDNINLIRKIVWSYHKSTGMDWDDLFQEAVLAYLEMADNYDSSRGEFSTYIWHCISSKLKKVLQMEKEYQQPLEPLEAVKQVEYAYPSFLDSLTTDARDVVNIISKRMGYFAVKSPADAKVAIIDTMRKQGWSIEKSWRVFNELEVACLRLTGDSKGRQYQYRTNAQRAFVKKYKNK